jgi:hypothetical protein
MKKQSIIKRIRFLVLATSICAAAALSTIAPGGSAAVPAVQDMRGVWNGFSAGTINPPEPVRTEITSQDTRRFTGFVSPPEPVLPISIEGTVSASGKVNYQGQSTDERIVGKTDLMDFGGGAAILDGSVTRFSTDGRFIIPCVLVMRPFEHNPPDPVLPSLAGRYAGAFTSNDAGPTGQINMSLANPPDPVRPTSFGGSLEIVINGQTNTYQLLATVNGAGHIVAIGHTNAAVGHLILDGVLINPPDPVQPATINGTLKLEFHDGSEFEGTFQTQVSRPAAT